MGRCKQKQRGLRGYHVAGPFLLLNERCTSLLRAPRLRNDLCCVEWGVKPKYTIPGTLSTLVFDPLRRYPIPRGTPHIPKTPHTSLSLEISDQLELLQKRALHIIYGGSHFNSDSYASYCSELGIETLRVRRDLIARRCFHRILEPTSCLHRLIPPKRTCSQTGKLRQSMPYSIPFAQRDFETFILYSLL